MQITNKMDAHYAANIVISSVKKSNLNYCIQESPFSLFINLRKTFIKNKSGNVAEAPTSEVTENTNDDNEQKIKVEKLEQDKSYLSDSIEQLKAELNETKDALYKLSVELKKAESKNLEAVTKEQDPKKEVENLENKNTVLEKKNDDLQVKVD